VVKITVPDDIRSSSLDNNINVTTLHYALAVEVDALRDRITELREDYNQLHIEFDKPKPFQWGAFASLIGVILAFLASIGGLVEQNISARIENIEKGSSYINMTIGDSIKSFDERHTKREDALEARLTSRIEDINTKALQLLTLKAEFQSVIDAIHQRQTRDESYIDQMLEKRLHK
jgi:hypothetical protein